MSKTKGTDILTPTGRLVGGSPWEPKTKDSEGRPLLTKNGPNAGQPRVEYYVALAIAKNDPQWPALYAILQNVAHQTFPNLFDAAGNCRAPQFAWKITDGDSQAPNTKGITPASRVGYPGNWVLHFQSGFDLKCFDRNNMPLTDPTSIKRGYYVRISGNVKGNDTPQQPGIYLNASLLQLVGYGEEIVTGPNAEQAFGAAPPPLPLGASAAPLAPANPPGAPVTPPPLPSTPGMPGAPATPPPLAPPAGIQPAPDFVNQVRGPLPPMTLPPAPPAPPVEPKYQYGGQAYTKAQLIAAGWTEAQVTGLTPA